MATSASLPVGFRFHPTEEEIIDHYLKNKIKGQHDFNDVIPEVDICSCEPWDLPGFSLIRSDDEEWYYFSRPDYKTKGNSRNRATERGFWKITGVEREIKARRSKALIGKKRTLTFYIGKVRSGQKTGWVIHEYYIPDVLLPNAARQRDFVLCRLKKKDESIDNGACGEGEVCEPSANDASDIQHLMANFGRPIIPEENTRPEEIFAQLFSSHESPHSPDYFASILGDNLLHANDDTDDHLDLQSAFRHEDSEEDDYSLEDMPRTNLFNHSSKPTSTLRKVFEETIQRQGLSIRDTNAFLLNHLLQKKASSVKVAENLPRNIGHVRSAKVVESEHEPIYELQAGSSSDSLLSASVKSYLNENGGKNGEMVTIGGAEEQSGPQLPLQLDDDYCEAQSGMARYPTAQSHQGHMKQGFKPQEVRFTSKVREMPLEPEKPWRNDVQKGMKKKQTIGDWKSSFIVWREFPLSLGSCPPVMYIRNMIGGLFLFIFFVGELISYGKW